MPRKIGLIAGSGDLPLEVARQSSILGEDLYIAALKGFARPADFTGVVKQFGLGEIGRLITFFKAHACTHICLAGKVARPDFSSLKPDFMGVKLLPKAIKAARQGDDTLLKLLLEVFEKQGFDILSPQEICLTSLMPKGALGACEPLSGQKADMDKAFQIAAYIGAEDIGQGAVVHQGLVLAVEAQEGTDKMLERVAGLPVEIRGGVLAKRLKPAQEARVDLPTIGLRTVELAKTAGLSGIVLEAGRAFVMDQDAVRGLADQSGIFIYGR